MVVHKSLNIKLKGIIVSPRDCMKQKHQGWYAGMLLKIVLQILLGKIAARLIFKIMLKSLYIGLEPLQKDDQMGASDAVNSGF